MNADRNYLAVGTYGSAQTHNLRILEVAENCSSVHQAVAISGGINPSYLYPSGEGRLLHVVNETNRSEHGKSGTLKTYRIRYPEMDLEYLSEVETFGDDPCFITETPDGSSLVVTNYGSGSVVILPRDEEGVPIAGSQQQKIQLMGFGPVRKRQDSAHPHWVAFSPEGAYLYIADLGSDRVWIYHHSHDGKYRCADIPAVMLPPGSGPRSLVFDNTRNIAFCLNELSSTIVQYRYDPHDGMLHPHKQVSTLPEGVHTPNLASEIQLHDVHVIASNRGHDSLILLKYDDAGFSHDVRWVESGGSVPRSLCILPGNGGADSCLAVANRASDSVTLFSMSGERLLPVRELRIPRPACVRMITVPDEDAG